MIRAKKNIKHLVLIVLMVVMTISTIPIGYAGAEEYSKYASKFNGTGEIVAPTLSADGWTFVQQCPEGTTFVDFYNTANSFVNMSNGALNIEACSETNWHRLQLDASSEIPVKNASSALPDGNADNWKTYLAMDAGYADAILFCVPKNDEPTANVKRFSIKKTGSLNIIEPIEMADILPDMFFYTKIDEKIDGVSIYSKTGLLLDAGGNPLEIYPSAEQGWYDLILSYDLLVPGGCPDGIEYSDYNFSDIYQIVEQGNDWNRTLYILIPRNEPRNIGFVTANKNAGTYNEKINVELSCETNGAEIRYTLDGSEPNLESELYISPININKNTKLKAKGFLGNANPSETFFADYKINVFPNEGTVDDPILINSIEDAVKLSGEVASGSEFKGMYFKLNADITLPEDWRPIGSLKAGIEPKNMTYITDTNPFCGHFDGCGHTVTVAENGLPLFGSVYEASIKNLNVYGKKIRGYGLIEWYRASENGGYGQNGATPYVIIDNVTIKSGSHILKSGLIGGFGNVSADIYNCKVEEGVVIGDDGSWGEIGDTTENYPYMGPFPHNDNVGSFCGAWNGNLVNCVSYATVYGRNNVGGLVGIKGQSMRECYINDCAFYGDIVATGNMVGGIVGSGYASNSAPNSPCVCIENCHATGNIAGSDRVGGIFGGEALVCDCWGNGIGRIRNNFFSGKITVTGSGANIKGGIIGYMHTLNLYNVIENNFYVNDCGAESGIGFIREMLGKYSGKHGRDDNPEDKDVDKLAKAIDKTELVNGKLVGLLNEYKAGRSDYVQGEKHPEFGTKRHIVKITSYNRLETSAEKNISNSLGLEKVLSNTAIVYYSDGTKKEISASDPEVIITGLEADFKGLRLAHLVYEDYAMPFGVRSDKQTGDEIAVRISIKGINLNDGSEEKHSLSKGNLTEWGAEVLVNGFSDESALELIARYCGMNEFLSLKEKNLNIISVTKATKNENLVYSFETLSNSTNAIQGRWLYSINGEYPMMPAGEMKNLKEGDVILLHWSDEPEEDIKAATKINPTPLNPEDKSLTVSFRLIGAEQAETDVNLPNTDLPNYVTWIPTHKYKMPIGSRVYDLFVKAIGDANLESVGAENDYVNKIKSPTGYWLGEFDNGKYSGWMYTVNGKHPNVGLTHQYLENGDEVIWHYVNDYRWEVEDWFDEPNWPSLAKQQGVTKYFNLWLNAPDYFGSAGGGLISATLENVTTAKDGNNEITTVKAEVNVSGDTATVTVKDENAAEMVKQAKEMKSSEIVLNADKAEANADKVKVELPKKVAENILADTKADLTVKLPEAEVKLSQAALKEITAQAKGDKLIIEVEKSKPNDEKKKLIGESADLFKLTVKSGDTVIHSFGEGKVTVRKLIPDRLKEKRVAVIYIPEAQLPENDPFEVMNGKRVTVDKKSFYEFTTSHFSDFALVDADEAGIEISESMTADEVKAIVKNLKLKATTKALKKSIRVTAKVDKETLMNLKDSGYELKYKYYRAVKKNGKYKLIATKKADKFTNAKVTKGKTYYYKVRLAVYDSEGKLIATTSLKNCKYGKRQLKKAA